MMLQERKTTLDTSCFFYEQQTDFTSVTSLWRNGQRIRLLIWGLRVRVPPGMCFWYFVGGSPFFSVGFVQYGTTISRARGCSSLMFGLFEIKMWFMLASSHQVGWQTILFEQTTNKNNKQTTTNKQQTNNKQTTNTMVGSRPVNTCWRPPKKAR